MPRRPHVSPATSPEESSESSSIDDMSQPGSSRNRCPNWSDAETRFLLEARMKYLQDEYKRMKDHNSRSGNNRETFDYFYEINAVLGCKPNIAPKRVFECGFLEDASSSSMETGDSKDPPQSSDQGDQSSDVCYC